MNKNAKITICAALCVVLMAMQPGKRGPDSPTQEPSAKKTRTVQELLSKAIAAQDFNAVQHAIENGADLNAKNANGGTPLMVVVQLISNNQTDENFLQIIRLLLANNANPNIITNDKITPLHQAVLGGNTRVVELLLAAAADPNLSLPSAFNTKSVLSYAVENNQSEIAQLLLEHGASVDSGGDNNMTPLFYAIQNRNHEMARLLLLFGAQPNYPDITAALELLNDSQLRENSALTTALVLFRLEPSVQTMRILQLLLPLEYAAGLATVEELQTIMKQYKKSVERNKFNETLKNALCWAASNRKLDNVRFLLTQLQGHPGLLKSSLEVLLGILMQNPIDESIEQILYKQNNARYIEIFKTIAAQLPQEMKEEFLTDLLLKRAIYSNTQSAINLLLSQGASFEHTIQKLNKILKLPYLDYDEWQDFKTIQEEITSKPYTPLKYRILYSQDSELHDRLHKDFLEAVITGNLQKVAKFLASGIDANLVRNNERQTALEIAYKHSNVEMVKLILRQPGIRPILGDFLDIASIRLPRPDLSPQQNEILRLIQEHLKNKKGVSP